VSITNPPFKCNIPINKSWRKRHCGWFFEADTYMTAVPPHTKV